MAYTLDQVYLTLREKYTMKLLAGASGIKATVSWVHMVETAELIPFLKRRELVITTGIRNQNMEDLRRMVIGLKGKKIAGLIINIGPYIQEVPKDIIAFCE
ncbi:MAG: PucR family transcriptional regulator ligand-binding domain-containing protein, partial [Lachnospiraceae bacterium]|nr:PucR family transcriptional regulator ligand-binding domain-containing protein [Lachnospiraceae bacterium]MBR1851716.1 PucR family transcriptional regulator ligand-binding domain-containing protein [Lachnospiraceae bacterium]